MGSQGAVRLCDRQGALRVESNESLWCHWLRCAVHRQGALRVEVNASLWGH